MGIIDKISGRFRRAVGGGESLDRGAMSGQTHHDEELRDKQRRIREHEESVRQREPAERKPEERHPPERATERPAPPGQAEQLRG
jgi:hypothetical protein